MPFAFFLLMLITPFLAFAIYRYLTLSFRLLEQVQEREPELWQTLGRPERVFVQDHPGGIHTIQPLFPWLGWVWNGERFGVPVRVRRLHREVRSYLVMGLAGLAAWLGAFSLLPWE